MDAFLHNIRQFLGRLSLSQKLAIGAVLVGGIVMLIGVAYWAGKPDYTLLFGRLEPGDANKIVESLKSSGTAYELREGGTAIFVPREQVYELRLQLAGEGMVSEGPVGYELFDKGTLGMTDFMQKLNLKRALEGELARTISSIRQVETCRVHLVIPERSPFRETQNQPSASVVIQPINGARLSDEQINGIATLVSGAVEGLSPADVTVLDTRGNMLSDPAAGDPETVASSHQLRFQSALETHLTNKGQSMLDRVLGPGNAIVRVTATVDFSRTVAERETIDPESATVVAEERVEVNGAADAQNSSIRNYELSRSRERSEKNVGEIDFLTVSVILNYKASGEDNEVSPYPEQELTEIEALVSNAVGYDPARGDRIAIHQTRFDTSVDERIATELRDQRESEQMQIYLRYALMLLALGVAVWLLRSASRRVAGTAEEDGLLQLGGANARSGQKGLQGGGRAALEGDDEYTPGQLTAHDESGELLLVDDVYTSKLSPEAKARLKAKHLMFEEIKKHVAGQPDDAAELIRSWMIADLNLDTVHV